MRVFSAADILIPDINKIGSYEKWAVLACDQFSSQPEYWDNAARMVGDASSTLNMILPEARLAVSGKREIENIHSAMTSYLEASLFRKLESAFVYVERVQSDGSLRRGILGCIDLEYYDYSEGSTSLIRASEKTVEERLPARISVREGAALELSHVILYADDDTDTLFSGLKTGKAEMEKLYDFELMMGGGQIRAYLLTPGQKEGFLSALDTCFKKQEEKAKEAGTAPLYFAVADGNHSLAAAKACYEMAKKNGSAKGNPHLRYALVELENLHDESEVFLPIHRLIENIDPEDLLEELKKKISCREKTGAGTINLVFATEAFEEELQICAASAGEAIAMIQGFLDHYTIKNGGSIDYIHGDESLRQLCDKKNTAGIFMPTVGKNDFFENIMKNGSYPRKTFSVGEGTDKRYYMELRKLL